MKRFQLPDLLKGIAVFFIIPVHVMQFFINQTGQESLLGQILFARRPIGVPVFLIVMGYFIARSRKSPGVTFMRGLKVFFVGILLNLGLNFHLLLKIIFSGWQYDPLEYIFGVDILYSAGLSIMVLASLKISKNYRGWIAALSFLVITGLTPFMNELLLVPEKNYILPFIAGNYSWSYFPLFPWLAYSLAGFAFFNFEDGLMSFFRKNKWVLVSSLVIIGLLVILFTKIYIPITLHHSDYYHHSFGYSLWVIGILVLWAMLLRYLLNAFPNTYAGDFFMWLGKNITLFYVIQWLIIGNIATVIYQTQDIQRYAFWFAGIFSVTVFLTWILAETRIKLA